MSTLPRHIITCKKVGETPLIALTRARAEHKIPHDVPLAYAGRLDPMASGALLILVGDECKRQTLYHAFDKEYRVELLFGVSSDTGDVLGLTTNTSTQRSISADECRKTLQALVGEIELPYPHFSAKTVRGKPLHMWTLEGRLDEIDVPTKRSRLYRMRFNDLRTASREEVVETVRAKIETIPKVTDPRKALGEDFRREAVRAGWDASANSGPASYQILTFTCTASSGTYMRSLCELIAARLGTSGLAYSIHRTVIGRYLPILGTFGVWRTRFGRFD